MGRAKINIEVKKIPVDLVNEPNMLVRDNLGTLDEIKSLGESILNHGQVQPILVRKNGERFDLIAGARRLHACKVVRAEVIEAKIIEATNEQAALMRWAENDQRLQNNPIEEARFLQEMLNNLNCSQVELSKKLNKSPAYVSQRLNILSGYDCVTEALAIGDINFNQARELYQMPDKDTAQLYVDVVRKGGGTAAVIRGWRQDLADDLAKTEVFETQDQDNGSAIEPSQLRLQYCECCRTAHYPQDLVFMRLCRPCETTIKTAK